MKIPQQDEIIKIEYKGERISAIVNSVIPHEGEKGAFWIWLKVGQEIPKGETVCWLLEEGRFPNASVHEVLKQNSQILIRLAAYQGAVPQQN
jgi:hypothetical protein